MLLLMLVDVCFFIFTLDGLVIFWKSIIKEAKGRIGQKVGYNAQKKCIKWDKSWVGQKYRQTLQM